MTAVRALVLGFAGVSLALAASSATAQQAKGLPDFRDMFIRLDANGDTVLEREEIPESGRAAFDRLLSRGDKNKDGKIDADEMRGLGQKLAALKGQAGAGAVPGVGLAGAARFQQVDKDDDGKISREEFPLAPALFDRIDADKDGSITRDEAMKYAAANAPKPAAEAPKPAKEAKKPEPEAKKPEAEAAKGDEAKATEPAPARAKAKANAKAKAAAAQAGPLARFQALDKDGDGKLSKDEFPRPKVFERLDTNNDGYLTRAELAKIAKGDN